MKGDFKLKCICGWDILLLYLSGMTDLEEWNSLCILGQMDVIRQRASGWIPDLHLLFRWVRVENPLFKRHVIAKAFTVLQTWKIFLVGSPELHVWFCSLHASMCSIS